MKTHISYTVLKAVRLLADAPQQTLSKVAARLGGGLPPKPASTPPPDHVTVRLETVFEALSELPSQPHIAAALDLACDTLQAELPTEAIAGGVYDIDSDEIRIVAARGLEHELLRGMAMPRARCFVGYAAESAIITSGDADGVDWLGRGGEGSTVLLSPILHDANLLGVLALADPLCSAEFNHHDVELVTYVAGQLAEFVQAHRHRARAAVAANR
jgi:GAF domain-containing protein